MADATPTSPTLDAAEIALVAELGERRPVVSGEYLYQAGDVTYDFFVLVDAEVDIVMTVDGEETLIIHHGPGRFLGELNMLSGLRVFVSARVVKAGEVLVVPRDRLRQLMATHPRLGDTILSTFLARRSLLMTGAAPAIRVIGSRFSPESQRVREFLARLLVPHEWLDPDNDPLVDDILRGFGISANELPVVIVSGSVLRRCPTPGELSKLPRADHGEPAGPLLRPGGGGRRARWPGRRRLRRLRGAAHPRGGDDGPRRAGRIEFADRELPGLPPWASRGSRS